MATLTGKGENFVAAAATGATAKKVRFQAHKADEAASDWLKILAYGHSGTGKTAAIEGFLKAGLRVFIANTDIGGDGLRTIKASLAAQGRTDLLANLASYDFTDYKSFNAWLNDPALVEVEGKDLWSWRPDLLAWEGMSNWQERHLGDYILLEQAPAGKATDLREAGLVADQQDWGAVRKATLRALDKFLILHAPDGRKIHKYVTTLEDNSKQDKLSGEIYRGPLIMGAARSYMGPAFDLIIEMSAKGKGKETVYSYKCGATTNALSKRRGLPVEPEEPGNMEALWKKIAPRPLCT